MNPSTLRENCGTYGGFKKHQRSNEVVCDACLVSRRSYEASYALKNREKILSYRVKYYQENAERISLRDKATRQERPRHKLELGRLWRLANPEKAREMARNDYQRHMSKRKETHAAWKANNPDLVQVHARKRRATMQNAPSEPYTVQNILDAHGTNCHICKEPIDLSAPRSVHKEGYQKGLHLDHVIPLSKGGSDLIENVKPSHAQCNIRKRDRLVA